MTSPMTSPTRPPYAGTRYPLLADVEGFGRFMTTGWEPLPIPATPVPGAAQAAAAHRERLGAVLPDATIVVSSGSAGHHGPFRPDRDFVWLTGCQAAGATLVMTPRPGGHDATLYLPAPLGPGTAGFATDKTRGEVWVGPSPDLAQWAAALELDVADVEGLEGARGLTGALAGRSVPAPLVTAHHLQPSEPLERHLARLRMVKDAWEIGQLRAAVDATVAGFGAVVTEIPRAMADGLGERWLQGTFDRHARTAGDGCGYPTIVGSGPHAAVLHWDRCDGPVQPDEVVLLDMGVEVASRYTADLTRTVPAGGTFTPAQRTVHDLVERAHRAGMAQLRAGTPYLDFHFATMEVIATGLHDWGLLPVSVDEALSPTGQQHRRHLPCGVGHHLGLDVHDCSAAPYEDYMGADLQAGMVMTVEPGLYFHPHDATVPPELRGLGVRLEDDLLVTDGEPEVLSAALPIEAAGIEAWTAAQWNS